jgi:hypothetical protein
MLQGTFVVRAQRLNPGKLDHVRAKDLSKCLAHILPLIGGSMEVREYLHNPNMASLYSVPFFYAGQLTSGQKPLSTDFFI